MKTVFMKTALAAAVIAGSLSTTATAAPRGSLEGPAEGAVVSGVVNIWGWAADLVPIKSVEFAIDNRPFVTRLGYGGSRHDVGNALPELYNGSYSGFAGAYHTKQLPNGEHLFRVRVTNELDEVAILENSLWVSNTPDRQTVWDEVDISNAVSRVAGNKLFLDYVSINGAYYDNVDLTFDAYSNAFRITRFKDDLNQDGYIDGDLNRDGYDDADTDYDGYREDDVNRDGFVNAADQRAGGENHSSGDSNTGDSGSGGDTNDHGSGDNGDDDAGDGGNSGNTDDHGSGDNGDDDAGDSGNSGNTDDHGSGDSGSGGDTDDHGSNDGGDEDAGNSGNGSNGGINGGTDPQVTSATAGRLLASQCAQCHGPDGVSHSGIDSLAGESADEIAEEFREFQLEKSNIMHFQALGYTDQEIQLIGQWFGGLSSVGGGDDD